MGSQGRIPAAQVARLEETMLTQSIRWSMADDPATSGLKSVMFILKPKDEVSK